MTPYEVLVLKEFAFATEKALIALTNAVEDLKFRVEHLEHPISEEWL